MEVLFCFYCCFGLSRVPLRACPLALITNTLYSIYFLVRETNLLYRIVADFVVG